MKIGIVTIYKAYNYGSYLQAYAMQRILEKLGHQVIILDCFKNKYSLIRSLISKKPSIMMFNIKRHFTYNRAWKELNIIKHKQQIFDVVIIGSDEVWNIKNCSFEHWPEYFGYRLNAKRIVAYAPSCGFTTLGDFLENQFYINGIKQIDHVFARDEATKIICQTIRHKECQEVVDPTILYLDNWKYEIKPFKDTYNNNYILYYSYNRNPLMLDYIKRFSKEKNLKIVVAGFKYDWCDESLIVEPKQFLFLMKNAKYVITTTFHGTIFAVIFKKLFIGFHPNKNQKVHDFLKQVGLEHRVHTANMTYSHFKDILEETIDYTSIQKKLKEKASDSINLLLNAIK